MAAGTCSMGGGWRPPRAGDRRPVVVVARGRAIVPANERAYESAGPV